MHFLFRTLENKFKKKTIYCGKSGKVSGMCGGKFIARCQKIRGKSGEDLPGKRELHFTHMEW